MNKQAKTQSVTALKGLIKKPEVTVSIDDMNLVLSTRSLMSGGIYTEREPSSTAVGKHTTVYEKR
jgi:hypothetical protein